MFKSFVNASNVSKFLPRLKTYPNNPAPFCVLRFLYRLVPIVRFFLVVTFGNKFFQLTLSYLATKERPLGNVTRLGVTFFLTILCLYTYLTHFHLVLPPNNFFTTTPPSVPNIGVAKAPIGNIPPLCFHHLLPPMYHRPRLTD